MNTQIKEVKLDVHNINIQLGLGKENQKLIQHF